MKLLKPFTILLLLIFSVCIVAGCSKENALDVNIYCRPEVNYKLYNSKDSSPGNISDVIGTTLAPQAYETFQITTNKTWTYGLVLEKVEFDIILSKAVNVDIDLTISNLENGENYNSTQDTYFYHKTLSFNQETTTVTLEINDTFINKDAVFSFEVVESCYSANPDLTISIANFKLFGEHAQTNY